MSNPPSISLATRPIGPDHPTLVIAEIGVNHDGSVRRAIDLVRHAAAVGADAVKLQLFTAQRLVSGSAPMARYQQVNCVAADQESLLRQYELSCEDVERIIDAARVEGLMPLATPFSVEDVFVIEHLDLPAVKIASPDLVNLPLLRRAARTGRPMLVSTGAATDSEITQCVRWLREWSTPTVLLHCISSYPTPAELANLCWVEALKAHGTLVGYSDHTTEPLAGALAVAAGACVVEKHLTWNRFASGPDHSASFDPDQFAAYVKSIRAAEALRGRGTRRVLPCEREVRRVSRQSVVARCDVPVGTVLSADHLMVQRPGTGICASQFDQLIGVRAAADIRAGSLLDWAMLEGRRADVA